MKKRNLRSVSLGVESVESRMLLSGSHLAHGTWHAEVFAVKDLGTATYATGINALGQVTGEMDTGGGLMHAFLSGPNGGPLKDLGILPGGAVSQGLGVNNLGQVAGAALTAGKVFDAVLSGPDGGPLKDLGTLPGDATSTGTGVNDLGQVTGHSVSFVNGSGSYHAFLSGPNGGPLKDLGALPGDTNVVGSGVNISSARSLGLHMQLSESRMHSSLHQMEDH